MSKCFFCDHPRSTSSYYPKFSFNQKTFEYRKCKACELVYIEPQLTQRDLQVLYHLDYHDEFYFTADKKYSRQEELLKKYKPSGKMLDYGCGDSSFLRYFEGKGYELHGAEFNPELVQKLQFSFAGIRFRTITSLLGADDQLYDIIHLGDVLEHLLNPNETIGLLRRKLAPGGILFVEGPIEHNFHLAYPTRTIYFNIRKFLQPQRIASMRPFHVLFANRKNQLQFFERLRFKTLHYEIFEWAWPYPGSWKNAPSLKLKFECLIARISVASSRFIKNWGNRFYYIGGPND